MSEPIQSGLFSSIRPDDSCFPLLGETDWLAVDGKAVWNEKFSTRLVDLRSKRWTALLRHRIGRLLLHDGYDGLFLDTIGNVEWPSLGPFMRNKQLQAAVQTLLLFEEGKAAENSLPVAQYYADTMGWPLYLSGRDYLR